MEYIGLNLHICFINQVQRYKKTWQKLTALETICHHLQMLPSNLALELKENNLSIIKDFMIRNVKGDK